MKTLAALNCYSNRGNKREDDSWNLHLVIRWTLVSEAKRERTWERN